jgi:hypothetical protein
MSRVGFIAVPDIIGAESGNNAPGHEQAAEREVDGDGPRDPVPPREPIGEPRALLVAHRHVVEAQAHRVEDRTEPIQLWAPMRVAQLANKPCS